MYPTTVERTPPIVDPKTIFQTKPEAEAVAEIVRRATEPRIIEIGNELPDNHEIVRGVLVHPAGLEVKSLKKLLDEYRLAPERRKGTAHVSALGSFIALVNRFKDGDSVIFADASQAAAPKLVAVLDYHRHGAEGAPRFGQHRIVYDFPVSDEWTAWRKNAGQGMQQGAFAEFIEEHLIDTIEPSGAKDGARKLADLLGCVFAAPQKLLELSRGLSVHVGHRVANAVNLATGEAQILFSEEHHDDKKQPLKIPGAFLLAIPVFRLGAIYEIPVRLRYRVQGGNVTWSYQLYRDAAVFEDAFTEACTSATQSTSLPLFIGTAEE